MNRHIEICCFFLVLQNEKRKSARLYKKQYFEEKSKLLVSLDYLYGVLLLFLTSNGWGSAKGEVRLVYC